MKIHSAVWSDMRNRELGKIPNPIYEKRFSPGRAFWNQRVASLSLKGWPQTEREEGIPGPQKRSLNKHPRNVLSLEFAVYGNMAKMARTSSC